jgi:Subunit CCDC53 of WASH complex
MLRVGVPSVSVEQKMAAEGLDPSLLHTPEAMIPLNVGGESDSDSDYDDSGSVSMCEECFCLFVPRFA